MPGMKEIKNRIGSVADTQKITSAMYLISSTKFRKAKMELDNTRPYFDALRTEIKRIFRTKADTQSIYFYPPKKGKRVGIAEVNEPNPSVKPDEVPAYEDIKGTYGYLVITADKGLAGAYNQNVVKEAMALMKRKKPEERKLFVVGEAGRHYFDIHNIPIEKSFLYTAQNPTILRAKEIAELLLDKYRKGELTKIYVIYTDMKNSIMQQVSSIRVLPFHRGDFLDHAEEKPIKCEFEFKPDMEKLLESIMPSYVSGFIYSALVDSFCCEQNARMMAMDAANVNAEKLISDLRIQYNHMRQNAITQEITEVAAGAKAKRKKLEKARLKRKKAQEAALDQ